MSPPTPQQVPLDPALKALQAHQKQDDILAIQGDIQQQSASLMARYGTRLALANAGGSGAMTSPLMAKTGGIHG